MLLRVILFWLACLLLMGGCGPTTLGEDVSTRGVSAKGQLEASLGPITVSLNPGWNPIGFQAGSLTTLTAASAAAGMVYYDNGGYQSKALTVSDVNAGAGTSRGFWVYATAATTFSYSGTDAGSVTLNLKGGWNLVAFPSNGNVPGSSLVCRRAGQTVPLSSVVLPSFYEIGANGNTVIDVSTGGSCAPGRAYWVFASDLVSLSYGSGPAPSPSATASASPTPLPSPTPSQGFFSLTTTTLDPPTHPTFSDSSSGYTVTYQPGTITYARWSNIGGVLGNITTRYEWGSPPAQIRPGDTWPLTGKATVLVNSGSPVGGDGSLDGRAPGGASIFPLRSNGGSEIYVNNTMPAATVVSRAATSQCPAGGTDFDLHMSAPTGNKDWSADYYYHYKWNP